MKTTNNIAFICLSAALVFSLTGCTEGANSMYGSPNYTGAFKSAMPRLTNPVGLAAMAPSEIMGNIKAENNRAAFQNMMQNGGPTGIIQQKMKESGIENQQPNAQANSSQNDELTQNNTVAPQGEQKSQEDSVGSKVGGFLGNVASGIATGAFEVMKNRLVR